MNCKNYFTSFILMGAVLCGASLFAKCAPAEKVELAYQLQPGDAYSVKITTDLTTISTTTDQLINLSTTTIKDSQEFKVAISDVDAEGNTLAKVTLVNMSYDPHSDSREEDDLFSKMLNVVKGVELGLTFTPTGKITNVSGFQDLSDRVAPLFEGETNKELITDLMDAFFSEDILTLRFQQFLCTYPSEMIKIGKEWKDEMEFRLFSGLKEKKTFLINSIFADLVSIDATTKITTQKKGGAFTSGPYKIYMEMSGKGKSSLLVGRETGWLHYSTSEGIAKGEITAKFKENGVKNKKTSPCEFRYVQTLESSKL